MTWTAPNRKSQAYRRLPLFERFDLGVNRTGGAEACWPWMDMRLDADYGQIEENKRAYKTHVLAFIIEHGRAPGAGKMVCHHCDHKPCCNPRHLYEGTASSNITDAWARLKKRAAPREPKPPRWPGRASREDVRGATRL